MKRMILFLMGVLLTRVHFESNRYQLLPSEIEKLDQNVAWLEENREAVLILEGHTDSWGEEGYNMELGDLRAREVKSYLVEKKIDPERIILVVSFGETKPIDLRLVNEAWAQNRRVEFVVR